jgi:hypothetical protein
LKVDDSFFDQSGAIANAESRKFVQGWMDQFVASVEYQSRRIGA